MGIKKAARASVCPFIVMDVLRAANEKAAAGDDVLHLEIGQPGGGPPDNVRDAVSRFVQNSAIGYTESMGDPNLRQAIAKHYRDFYDADIPAERIAVTIGSSGGFILSFIACFDAGDRVALARPGYPAYRNMLKSLDLIPVEIDVDETTHYHITPTHLDALDAPVDGLIIASPGNPTGSMLSEDELTALADWCKANAVRLISDEIYHGIAYEQRAATAAVYHEAITINSFSKYFAMPGWRLGWLVLPEDLTRAVDCLQQNLFISASSLAQAGGLACLEAVDALDERVEAYAENRRILLDCLKSCGICDMAPPDGAFYIYADIRQFLGREGLKTAQDFCAALLHEEGIAITPGNDFDPIRGTGMIRLSFAGPTTEIKAAAIRLKRFMEKLKG